MGPLVNGIRSDGGVNFERTDLVVRSPVDRLGLEALTDAFMQRRGDFRRKNRFGRFGTNNFMCGLSEDSPHVSESVSSQVSFSGENVIL